MSCQNQSQSSPATAPSGYHVLTIPPNASIEECKPVRSRDGQLAVPSSSARHRLNELSLTVDAAADASGDRVNAAEGGIGHENLKNRGP